MRRRRTTQLPKRTQAKADALIAKFAMEMRGELPDVTELLAAWPLVFRGALSYLLSEFDYAANHDSKTATAVRLLALSADRFERARASLR